MKPVLLELHEKSWWQNLSASLLQSCWPVCQRLRQTASNWQERELLQALWSGFFLSHKTERLQKQTALRAWRSPSERHLTTTEENHTCVWMVSALVNGQCLCVVMRYTLMYVGGKGRCQSRFWPSYSVCVRVYLKSLPNLMLTQVWIWVEWRGEGVSRCWHRRMFWGGVLGASWGKGVEWW